MKIHVLFLPIVLTLFFIGNEVENDENIVIGKWKVSGMFCSEEQEVPKGFVFTFFKDKKGYLEHENVNEIENFSWKINGDTLRLNFERESEVKNMLFKSDDFLIRELNWREKHIQLRYLDFKQCGVLLEFIK